MTPAAAEHNSKILERHEFDLPKALMAVASGTQLEYGSEFRPPAELKPILYQHHLWQRTERLLLQGSVIPLHPSDPLKDKVDVALGLQRGNHKGATN